MTIKEQAVSDATHFLCHRTSQAHRHHLIQHPGDRTVMKAEPVARLGPSGFDPGERFAPAQYEGKPRWLSRDAKRLLRSFIDPMYERIGAMTQDERAEFITACRKVSRVNCGWDEYAIAKMLHDIALYDFNAAGIEARSDAAPKSDAAGTAKARSRKGAAL